MLDRLQRAFFLLLFFVIGAAFFSAMFCTHLDGLGRLCGAAVGAIVLLALLIHLVGERAVARAHLIAREVLRGAAKTAMALARGLKSVVDSLAR